MAKRWSDEREDYWQMAEYDYYMNWKENRYAERARSYPRSLGESEWDNYYVVCEEIFKTYFKEIFPKQGHITVQIYSILLGGQNDQ